MNAFKKVMIVMRLAICVAATIALLGELAGCAVHEPLSSENLLEEAKDPHVAIVLLRFKSQQSPPEKGLFGSVYRKSISWEFAVANESTGWNFRRLDPYSMVFHTRDDSMEQDPLNAISGWVTFLVPSGVSYIAVSSVAPVGQTQHWVMDYIDMPRFSVEIPEPRTLVYAGTIVRSFSCGAGERSSICPIGFSVVDENELAKSFIYRYPKGFAGTSSMQTKLLTILQTRTIVIPGGAASQ